MSKRQKGFSRIEKIVIVLVALALIFIAFNGSVCTGSYEGSSDAVCEKIIK